MNQYQGSIMGCAWLEFHLLLLYHIEGNFRQVVVFKQDKNLIMTTQSSLNCSIFHYCTVKRSTGLLVLLRHSSSLDIMVKVVPLTISQHHRKVLANISSHNYCHAGNTLYKWQYTTYPDIVMSMILCMLHMHITACYLAEKNPMFYSYSEVLLTFVRQPPNISH